MDRSIVNRCTIAAKKYHLGAIAAPFFVCYSLISLNN
ncbi:hypothetical protein [Salmonella phage NINP13076]|nr:hypothetical protein [Salmonella phage NINP13076]